MLTKTAVFTFLFFIMTVTHAQIYQWIDEQGSAHFSDTYHPNAKSIKLKETLTFKSTVSTDQQSKKLSSSHYQTLQIIAPKNKATIRNNQGAVTVKWLINPALRAADKIVLLLDNQIMGIKHSSFTNLDRGEHHLIIQVRNSYDTVLMQSQPIIFYMHRPRIVMPRQH